ncbi:MAG TPA: Smr/MutS family protein [Allosphingosinicella sp.]|nr:Smr/MutS family protein [Allosphingosinicella sp.]
MRPLNAEEERLWRKVVETVRPLRPRAAETGIEEPALPPPEPVRKAARPAPAPPPAPAKGIGETLDAGWDRRLSRGLVQPDVTLDLHGHGLASAYDLLDSRLASAISSGARVLLLITGKPPAGDRPGRGRIRAAVGDWLGASRHAGSIAAVRGAHQRHGGSGALYIVLRRRR